MTEFRIKRVYEDASPDDGFRVFVDRLWPRGMKKENLKFDLWDKDIAPSPALRQWFHESPDENWEKFAQMYRQELTNSPAVIDFLKIVKDKKVVTFLYASKSPDHNHALVLRDFFSKMA